MRFLLDRIKSPVKKPSRKQAGLYKFLWLALGWAVTAYQLYRFDKQVLEAFYALPTEYTSTRMRVLEYLRVAPLIMAFFMNTVIANKYGSEHTLKSAGLPANKLRSVSPYPSIIVFYPTFTLLLRTIYGVFLWSLPTDLDMLYTHATVTLIYQSFFLVSIVGLVLTITVAKAYGKRFIPAAMFTDNPWSTDEEEAEQ